MSALSLDDIEMALYFVSSQGVGMNEALLCRDTGEIFYESDMDDSDEMPADIDDSNRYVAIPHKNELGLGRGLVEEFMDQYIPESVGRVATMFCRKGAYSRYKEFLDSEGKLELWHEYENERTREALRKWCEAEGLELGEGLVHETRPNRAVTGNRT